MFSIIYCFTVKKRQYIPPKGIKNRLLDQHYVFLLLLFSNLLSSASSIGGVYLQSIASQETVFWQYLLHALYFFFHTTLSISFALYIMNVNGTSHGRTPGFYFLFSLPYLLSEAIVLTNSFTGLAFYMDEEYIYHRGPMMVFLYACGALYIVLGFLFFFRHKQALSKGDRAVIGIVIIVATIGIAVQAVRSDLLVELFFESLAFIVMMMLLEERSGHIDPVTGALNRIAFSDTNRRLIKTDQRYSLILIKLTNLDLFSKLFRGREMDIVLMRIAAWLSSISSEKDVFYYRQGQFAVVCQDKDNEEVRELAETILDRFRHDWDAEVLSLRLDVAVCVVNIPEDIPTLSKLDELLAADYHKTRQGSVLVSYREISDMLKQNEIELALKKALDEGEISVYYQPIWSVKAGRAVAAEALLRINNDDFCGVSPEVYIPVAEKSGLIRNIGLAVFEEVCRFISEGQLPRLGLEYIEINLSLYQFMYDDMITQFEDIRQRYGVPVETINFEITETATEREAPAVTEMIKTMTDTGYTFSLDDFGTGYSNLNRLVNSGYKNIKIDKTLLWDAEKNPQTAKLLDTIFKVMLGFEYSIVQEGVETEAQLKQVTDSGVDLIQGYYFARPMPETELIGFLTGKQGEQNKA